MSTADLYTRRKNKSAKNKGKYCKVDRIVSKKPADLYVGFGTIS